MLRFFQNITSDGILVSIGTVLSPIVALEISRWIEKKRFQKEKQLQLFRLLMQHRANPLVTEFVQALNLVEVEFHRYPDIVEARQTLQECFNRDVCTQAGHMRQAEDIHNLIALLLSKIANVLEIKVNQLNIRSGSYIPQAWQDDLNARKVREEALYLVLSGKMPIRVSVSSETTPSEQDTSK